jgi:hypothetical protein
MPVIRVIGAHLNGISTHFQFITVEYEPSPCGIAVKHTDLGRKLHISTNETDSMEHDYAEETAGSILTPAETSYQVALLSYRLISTNASKPLLQAGRPHS